MLIRKKSVPVKLSPFNCELCTHNTVCMFGRARDELRRCGLSIRFADCAEVNGGKLFTEDKPKAVHS